MNRKNIYTGALCLALLAIGISPVSAEELTQYEGVDALGVSYLNGALTVSW